MLVPGADRSYNEGGAGASLAGQQDPSLRVETWHAADRPGAFFELELRVTCLVVGFKVKCEGLRNAVHPKKQGFRRCLTSLVGSVGTP